MTSVQILPASSRLMVKTMLFFILHIPLHHAALRFNKSGTIPSLHTQIKSTEMSKVKVWIMNLVRFSFPLTFSYLDRFAREPTLTFATTAHTCSTTLAGRAKAG